MATDLPYVSIQLNVFPFLLQGHFVDIYNFVSVLIWVPGLINYGHYVG